MRKLITKIHKSNNLTTQLESAQNNKKLKVILDCPTRLIIQLIVNIGIIIILSHRWNSTYEMIERYLLLEDVMFECFEDTHTNLLPEKEEIELLKSLMPILKPLSLVTQVYNLLYYYLVFNNYYIIILKYIKY